MAVETVTRRSRRALLMGAVGGLAATAAAALGRPLSVQGADGDPVLRGQYNATTSSTTVESSDGYGFEGITNAEGPSGLLGSATPTSGSSIGVLGQAVSTSGMGVVGFVSATSGATWGTLGQSKSPTGTGALGWSSASSTGVMGVSSSSSGSPPPAALANTGVYGTALDPGGRGAQFAGKAAQIRLRPSTATTHPASGSAGDIFVDKAKRVWFCKGGTTWARLDT